MAVSTQNINPGTSTQSLPSANWTLQNAAEWLGVSERMVRRLVAERRIAYVKIGRYVRFRPEDVQSYRDGNVHPAALIERHILGVGSRLK